MGCVNSPRVHAREKEKKEGRVVKKIEKGSVARWWMSRTKRKESGRGPRTWEANSQQIERSARACGIDFSVNNIILKCSHGCNLPYNFASDFLSFFFLSFFLEMRLGLYFGSF
jgi:hypothetical protein